MDRAQSHQQFRAAMPNLCARFPGECWRKNEVYPDNLDVPAQNLLGLLRSYQQPAASRPRYRERPEASYNRSVTLRSTDAVMMNYRGIHDMGGLPAGTVQPSEHDYALWEKRVDALLVLLTKKGLMTVDELRRNIEGLGLDAYDKMSYYERWIYSITQTLIQRGIISIDELGRKMAEAQNRTDGGR